MNIVIGVTGSISAYKAADVVNRLTKKGHDVHVVLTKAGSEFITPLTLQTLSKNKVEMDAFEEDNPAIVKHIDFAANADVVAIVPASADIIARIAAGMGDDLLTCVALAAWDQAKLVIAPAMNTHMYQNPITQRNIDTLKSIGYQVIEPKSSHLACGYDGKGALADVDEIVEYIDKL